MRLWHKDLIPYLPRQQLLGQWRECCAIAKHIYDTGLPNHILVNRILYYFPEHFDVYADLVRTEMLSRGYKCDWDKFYKYRHCFSRGRMISSHECFNDWHNDRYLRQCLYNLQEKYDCGGISEEEWDKITNKFVVMK